MHALAGELDIRKMGDLRAKMPTTYWTFLIGAAALAGIPLLLRLLQQGRDPVVRLGEVAAAAVAGGRDHRRLTAFYTFRSVFVPSGAQERDQKLTSATRTSRRPS